MSHEHVSLDVNARESVPAAPKSEGDVTLPLCTESPGTAGCTLSQAKRNELHREFTTNVIATGALYQTALTNVKVDTLLEKDEEMHWFASVILDVTSMFLVSTVAKAAAHFAAPLVKKLPSTFHSQLAAGAPGGHAPAGHHAVDAVAEKASEKGLDPIKDVAKDGLKSTPERIHDNKRDASDYIMTLYNAAHVSFTSLATQLPKTATDQELIRARDAFAPERVNIGTFIAEIRKKVHMYLNSGLRDIGRKHATVETGAKFQGRVVRDTRVAWHVYKSGFPKQLVYEHMDGAMAPWVLDQWEAKKDRIKMEAGHKMTFGPLRSIHTEAQAGASVPDELTQIAVARHRDVWGDEPRVVEIDDTRWDPTRVHIARGVNAGIKK